MRALLLGIIVLIIGFVLVYQLRNFNNKQLYISEKGDIASAFDRAMGVAVYQTGLSRFFNLVLSARETMDINYNISAHDSQEALGPICSYFLKYFTDYFDYYWTLCELKIMLCKLKIW